jgi:hypothetical protein
MTDETNNAPASAEDTFAALRAGRTSHPATRIKVTEAYEGASARVAQPGAVLDAGDAEVIAAQRAASGARLGDVVNDINRLTSRIGYLQERLGEGRHDPRTGTRVDAVQGTLRAGFETELASLTEELWVSEQTRLAVLSRQARDAAREQTRVENDAAEADFVNGSKERAAALHAAKLKIEAEKMAEWLLRRQYGA